MSRPVRGAWIETDNSTVGVCNLPSRVPYGARGLKQSESIEPTEAAGRVPYGARGLKHGSYRDATGTRRSRPVRGAWIETENW